MSVVVFDIGGTNVKFSLMSEAGDRLEAGELPTPQDSVEQLVNLVRGVWERLGAGAQGIAVSAPGLVDADTGYLRTGGALAYNYGQPLGELLSQACGCRVRVENDGKCAALAELRTGALRGVRNGCVFIIGTAVGGGIVVDGELRRGPRGAMGELSWAATSLEGWGDIRSYVGDVCGTTGLLRLMRKATGLSAEELPDGRAAFALVAAGDARATSAFERYCRLVALQLHNLTVTLDLERVAIGGGISNQDLLIEGVRRAARKLHDALPEMLRSSTEVPQIVRCAYGSEANQLGALYSFLDSAE